MHRFVLVPVLNPTRDEIDYAAQDAEAAEAQADTEAGHVLRRVFG
jgi:hypothetical protein